MFSDLKLPSVNNNKSTKGRAAVAGGDKSYSLVSKLQMKKDGSRKPASPATQYSSKKALKQITSIYDAK